MTHGHMSCECRLCNSVWSFIMKNAEKKRKIYEEILLIELLIKTSVILIEEQISFYQKFNHQNLYIAFYVSDYIKWCDRVWDILSIFGSIISIAGSLHATLLPLQSGPNMFQVVFSLFDSFFISCITGYQVSIQFIVFQKV